MSICLTKRLANALDRGFAQTPWTCKVSTLCQGVWRGLRNAFNIAACSQASPGFLFLFCFVLFCFALLCFVLFCFVLFCWTLSGLSWTWIGSQSASGHVESLSQPFCVFLFSRISLWNGWLGGFLRLPPIESIATVDQQRGGLCLLSCTESVGPSWQQSHRCLYPAPTCKTQDAATQRLALWAVPGRRPETPAALTQSCHRFLEINSFQNVIGFLLFSSALDDYFWHFHPVLSSFFVAINCQSNHTTIFPFYKRQNHKKPEICQWFPST